MKKHVLALIVALSAIPAATPVAAKDIPSTKVPAVVKTLGNRYRLPQPVRAHGAAVANSAKDLSDLVAIEQHHFPGAVVTSGFYDWRTTSVYRSHAGLHLGYDIAMPYGAPFAAGWAGTVTSVVHWYGEQYGITVEAPDGTQVTYGHVAPKVNVGQSVMPGDVLGTIALDHLDVKMRDANGNYVDFGGNGRVIPQPQWASSSWVTPQASSEAIMANWLLASNNLELAKEDLERFKLESEGRRLERQRLKGKIPTLEHSVKMMGDYVERGLVARVTAEESREELEHSKARLKKVDAAAKNDPRQLKLLQTHLKSAQERFAQAKRMAENRGLSWKNVQSFVNSTVANDATLQKNVSAYKKAAGRKNEKRLAELDTKLKSSEQHLKAMEELYEMGGVAKLELEGVRQKHKVLVAQMRALKAQTQD